jgi:hypothetical protein
MGTLVGIAIMTCLALVYWWATVFEKKRRDKLIALARSLDLEISWELNPQDNERFKRFAIATKGRVQHVNMVLCADTGETRMVIFDYEYVTGHGKHRITRDFSMVLCVDTRFNAPKLSLEPESWTTKIAAMVGTRDINFNEDPAFSSTFQLSGTDEAAIRSFMNDSRRKALMAQPPVRLEIEGDSLLVVQPYYKLSEETIRTYMSRALTLTHIMVDRAN